MFTYGDYQLWCIYPGGGFSTDQWQIIPETWHGDTPTTSADTSYNDGYVLMPYSATVHPGTYFRRDANKAETYTYAVSVFGTHLYAWSGFSQYVQEYWHAGSKGGCLYGMSNYPPNALVINTGPTYNGICH
jgi:hypothetical protein